MYISVILTAWRINQLDSRWTVEKKHLHYFYLPVSIHRITFLAVVSYLRKMKRNESINQSVSQFLRIQGGTVEQKISTLFLLVSQYALNNIFGCFIISHKKKIKLNKINKLNSWGFKVGQWRKKYLHYFYLLVNVYWTTVLVIVSVLTKKRWNSLNQHKK